MPDLAFRLVNVFATGATLSGNPLCVFEDGTGLSDADMLALAIQFNLSETTFILPAADADADADADARVRIFTPNGELPFAGHPTLGTAAVVAQRQGRVDGVRLDMIAGCIPVEIAADRFTLTANAPRWREPGAGSAALATLLGLEASDVVPGALRVDTGMDQLLIPLASEAALRRARPDPGLAACHANDRGLIKICCFVDGAGPHVPMRFFFGKQPGVIAEDPGTGSACANLGGWWIARQRPLPYEATLLQGDHLGRACRLGLAVAADRTIRVSGRVVEVARGVLRF